MRKSFVSLERSFKMDSSSRSKLLLCVGVCEAGRSLFTVSGMSDSAARSPEERKRPVLHANEHAPTKWTRARSPSPLPSLTPHPTPPCPHLAPRCLLFDTSTRKHAGSRPPLRAEGEFYLTGSKICPEWARRLYHKNVRGEAAIL